MKRYILVLLAALSFSSCGSLGGLSGMNTSGTISETDAASGIREALDKGVTTGINLLHRENGFFGSDVYKLFLPAEAQNIVTTLKNMGMSGLVYRAVLQIKRAEE